MSMNNEILSSGIPSLDELLKGLLPGDNIVWQSETIEEFQEFAKPYCHSAKIHGQKLIYFRFAHHESLVEEDFLGDTYILDPREGFEPFIIKIHSVIGANGYGGYYLFDCLTELAEIWGSDQMLGNFFMLTCPYLLDMEALAYFNLKKNRHSFRASAPIMETTQIFIDIYTHKQQTFVHPIKVQQRYSRTMHMLHQKKDDQFYPVYGSVLSSQILTSHPWAGEEISRRETDVWTATFYEGERLLEAQKKGETSALQIEKIREKLIWMCITRDDNLSELVKKYFSLNDLMAIGKRMIGTGLIGGKSVGMLLARKILNKEDSSFSEILETHDSFYIGSDVFYTYTVLNGCWWLKDEKEDLDAILSHFRHSRRRIQTGKFPDYLKNKFTDILNYFGPCPLIIRSSSLLEDNFGNAFSGKYESVFCPNQGSYERKLDDFISAIKIVYASAFHEKALRYRAQCGLLDKDEEMSLLVQRVSGKFHGSLFYPDAAGVAYSYNPFVWDKNIDPEAGVIRLVLGMGTRAVDRSDDDYTRIAALNIPEKRPETSFSQVREFSQKRVDVIDLEANQLVARDLEKVVATENNPSLDYILSRDLEVENLARQRGKKIFSKVITFDHLFKSTSFVQKMKELLRIISTSYAYPVDIEFTTNINDDGRYFINIVQCRPFQARKIKQVSDLKIDDSCKILETFGPVIGSSRDGIITRIIYVNPKTYKDLTDRDRYALARTIGNINNLSNRSKGEEILLIGPGRWGTTTPSLGVPVNFSEINQVSYLCEILCMSENITPDASLGTHFFNDLVDVDMVYLGLNPEITPFNQDFFESAENLLPVLLPKSSAAEKFKDVLRVIDFPDKKIRIQTNSLNPHVLVYRYQ